MKNYVPLSIDIPIDERGSFIGEITPENNPLFAYPLSGHSDTHTYSPRLQDKNLVNDSSLNIKSSIKNRDTKNANEIHLKSPHDAKILSSLSDRDQNEIQTNMEVSIFNHTIGLNNESKNVIVEVIETKFDDENKKKEMVFQLNSDASINLIQLVQKTDMEIQCLIDYASIHRKAISTITTTSSTSNIPSPREFGEVPVYNDIHFIKKKGIQEIIRKVISFPPISVSRIVESPLLYFVDKKYEEWLKGNEFKKEKWKIAEKEYFFMVI